MKRACFILAQLMLAVFGRPALAEDYGLMFSSYDVPADKRTSLQIEFPSSKSLKISESTVKIGFDVMFDYSKEHYGYVCRIPLSEDISLDVVLSNSRIVKKSDDIIAVLGDNVVSAMPEGGTLGDWNRIEMEFENADDTLAVTINGNPIKLPGSNSEYEISAILFGRHTYGELRSNDVAPMTVRNLVIDSQGRKTVHYEYPLKDETGLVGAIANPIWLSEYNTLWHLQFDIPANGKVFHALDSKNHYLYLISDTSVERCSLKNNSCEIRQFSQKLTMEPLTNDFGVLPDGTLYYFDAETYTTAFFDWEESSWSKDIVKDTYSPYLGHSTFFNPADSSIVQLFGYGYHRYSNEAHTWNIVSGKFRRFNIDAIPPRYFSCLYQTDSSVYVIGGLGNSLGLQELGIESLDDVYEVNLNDYSATKVIMPKQVFSESMVSYGNAIRCNGKYHMLFFPYLSSDSGLRLISYNPETSSIDGMSDKIEYSMSIWSEFFLDYIEENNTWCAIVSTMDSNEQYHTRVYNSVNPLGFTETTPSSGRSRLWGAFFVLLCVAGASVGGLLVYKKKKRRSTVHIHNIHPDRPGIYLIGAFRIVGQNGDEVGSSFSPLMKELLSLLILNYKTGVPAHEFNLALWPDMEESNFRNNFRVNLKKVRDGLKDVVPVEIYKDAGFWKISIAEDDCDYLAAMNIIEILSSGHLPEAEIDRLVSRFKGGNLLGDISKEWVDKYKGSYSADVISMCYRLIDDFNSPEARLKLSEVILSLDSLEEDAASIKCKSLIQLKKVNYAQDYFRAFANDYQRLIGEPLDKDFKNFVK